MGECYLHLPRYSCERRTDINKELLQLMEDRIVLLMNRVFNGLTANPFIIQIYID